MIHKKRKFWAGSGGGKCPLSTPPDTAPVCSYSNSSTDMGCLESDDPNSQLASSGRLNHSPPQKEECQGPCMSPTSGTTSTNASTSSTATHTKEYAGRLQQCNVFGNTTKSHFPLLRLKRNQPCFEGGGHKTLHHHVLQPKHSVMYWPRVGELEPKYRIKMRTAIHQRITWSTTRTPRTLGRVLNDYLNPNTSSMKIVSWNCKGVGNKAFHTYAHELYQILIIVESRIVDDRAQAVIDTFPYFHSQRVGSIVKAHLVGKTI